MQEKEILVTIQILNWNRAEETVRAIKSALNQSYKNTEIVLVDNGSEDNSVEVVKFNFPDITIVELDKNYGCPGGRNRGIEYCNGEYIFYLDNDGVLHEDAVKNAVKTFEEYPDVGILTGKVYDFDNETEINTKISPLNDSTYYYNNFQGGICMHKKSIYNDIGNYPDHFMYGGEEWFMTCKAIDNNIKIIKNESVILWHKRSDLARNREREILNAYYNKLYVCVALYPIKYALQFLVYFPYKYIKYAEKEGIKKSFISSLRTRYFKTIYSAFKNRSPIKESSYIILKKNVTSN